MLTVKENQIIAYKTDGTEIALPYFTNSDSAYLGQLRDEILPNMKAKKFQNISVPTSSWVENDEETPPYKSEITCLGVTENHFAQVVFSDEDCTNNDFSRICKSGDNKVTIYANDIPSESITILSIVCI